MKKTLLFILLSMFVLVGVGVAHETAYDPKVGGSYIVVPVHNDINNAATLDAGDMVVADMSASTGDNDFYVATTTAVDTGTIVGVIWPADIASGESGSMAIWGLVQCDLGIEGAATDSPLCSSATAGGGGTCASTTTQNSYAITSVSGGALGQVNCFVNL